MVDHLVLGDEEISDWVRESKVIRSVTRLPGDASSRRYYRIFSKNKNYIVMRMEPFKDQGDKLPFLAVQRHLASSGVDVPEVLDFDAERGFILLEDLGDTTLLRKLQEVGNLETEYKFYQRCIDALVTLHVNASPEPKKGKVKGDSKKPALDAFSLRFDHEKLMWEVNFTIDQFYKIYLKRTFKGKDLKLIEDGFSGLCEYLADLPTVLTHRDYHSRNIMCLDGAPVRGAKDRGRWVMIDFQDARMGPPQYDLASLLRDSYYQLEEEQISRLIDYYIDSIEEKKPGKIDRQKFRYGFDLMSVQRNFKAIGSFASFMNRRGDPGYLKYIGNTFENLRRTLLKYPESPKLTKLREALYYYYYF